MQHTQIIIPAIIPKSLDNLKDSLARVAPFARSVQIDIVDGVFVPSISWPYQELGRIESLSPLIENFEVEMDLMVMNPEDVIETYLQSGVSRVVIHLESTNHFKAIVALKEKYNFLLGISINNDTPLTKLAEYINDIEYVQLMGIAQIGSQGQPFDERVLERISILKDTYPYLEISIDGSVNSDSLPRLLGAGATRFAVGSAIVGAEHPQEAYEVLTQMAGVFL